MNLWLKQHSTYAYAYIKLQFFKREHTKEGTVDLETQYLSLWFSPVSH